VLFVDGGVGCWIIIGKEMHRSQSKLKNFCGVFGDVSKFSPPFFLICRRSRFAHISFNERGSDGSFTFILFLTNLVVF